MRVFERVPDIASGTLRLIDETDHFEQVTDGTGHAAGDAIPKRIVQVLRQQSRAESLVGARQTTDQAASGERP